MTTSSRAKATDAVARLQAWLAQHPIPRRNGRVNRTAICQAVGLTRSTLGSNPRLKAMIEALDESPCPVREPVDATSDLERQLAALREENAALRRQLDRVAWLLSLGRCIRP